MQIGFLQFAPQDRTIEENIQFIIHETEKIKNAFIVLPELFLTSYVHPDPIENNLLEKTLLPLLDHSQKNNLSFVGSLAIKDKDKIKNQGIYISRGKIMGVYTKRKLYDKEKEYFQSGKEQYSVFTYDKHPFTIQICIDNINPIIARWATERGILILAAPSTVSVNFLNSVLKARSLENQLIVIFTNRIGKDVNGIVYCGLSTIFIPDGTKYTADKYNKSLQIVSITKQQLNQFTKTRKMLLQEDYAKKRSRARTPQRA